MSSRAKRVLDHREPGPPVKHQKFGDLKLDKTFIAFNKENVSKFSQETKDKMQDITTSEWTGKQFPNGETSIFKLIFKWLGALQVLLFKSFLIL